MLSKKHILLVVNRVVVADEIIALLEQFEQNKLHTLIIVSDNIALIKKIYKENLSFVKFCTMRGTSYPGNFKNLPLKQSSEKVTRNFRGKILLPNFIRLYINILRSRYNFHRLNKIYKPKALVVFDDRRVFPELVFLKMARQCNIPRILASHAISDTQAPLFTRRDKHEHYINTPLKRIFGTLFLKYFRNQVYQCKDKKILFYTMIDSYILFFCGLLYNKPWLFGGGDVSKICIFNQFSKNRLVDQGTAEKKIIVTGQASSDSILENHHKSSFFRKYSFDKNKKVIIFAVPQYAEHNLLGWKEHEKLIIFHLEHFKRQNCNVLLSLHPKQNANYYKNLAAPYSIAIAEEKLKDIISFSHIFIATYSSTIRWSTALSIPSIIVDFIAQNYDVFNDIQNLIIVKNKNDFLKMLDKLLIDKVFYSTIQQGLKKEITPIDGLAAQRIVSVINDEVTDNE